MRNMINREREIIEKSKGLNKSAKAPNISKEKSFELNKQQDQEYKRYLFFNNLRRILVEDND